MASIPCAAYQASHIHASMRRKEMEERARKRHNSNASVDSTASDSHSISDNNMSAPLNNATNGHAKPTIDRRISQTEPTPPSPLTRDAPEHYGQQGQVTMWDKMDQVSQWVSNGVKKLRIPYLGSHTIDTRLAEKISENNLSASTVTRQTTVMKSET